MQKLKKPIVNALCASGYIVFIVALLNLVSQTQANKADTAFAPVAFLSLLTLSVAVMAYLFLYQPLMLFIDGKRKESVAFFIQVVAVFAGFTALIWIFVLTGLI